MNTAQAMPQNMANQSRNRRGSGLAGWLVIFSCALVGINVAKQQFCALPSSGASAKNGGGGYAGVAANDDAQKWTKRDSATQLWQETRFICNKRARKA